MIATKGFLAALSLLLGTTAALAAQPTAPRPASSKHDPVVEAQLRASFGRVDLNRDGFLDDAELAKAFRGTTAKPPPPLSFDEKGYPIRPAGPSTTSYPDQVYRLALDRNSDGRISWAEFDEYGESYAAQFKNTQQLNQQALRTAYAQAQRLQAQRYNINYSRYGNRYYHRPVRSHQRYVGARTSQAHRVQDQRHTLQDRRHILQDQRSYSSYSRYGPHLHRPVRSHRTHHGRH